MQAQDNPWLSPETLRNPHPAFAAMREAAPVHFVEPLMGSYVVSRHEDVLHVLNAHELFSSDAMRAFTTVNSAIRPVRGAPPRAAVSAPGEGRECSAPGQGRRQRGQHVPGARLHAHVRQRVSAALADVEDADGHVPVRGALDEAEARVDGQ